MPNTNKADIICTQESKAAVLFPCDFLADEVLSEIKIFSLLLRRPNLCELLTLVVNSLEADLIPEFSNGAMQFSNSNVSMGDSE